jgi:predicted DNA-binding transcriptional regulator AlpA
MAKQALEERLWTPDELAARYGISPLTLRQWRWQGIGPRPLKVGRRVLYPESEIAAWERKRAAAS